MISFTLGWKRNRLFLYSAISREIVSIIASMNGSGLGPPPRNGGAPPSAARPPYWISFIEAFMKTVSG